MLSEDCLKFYTWVLNERGEKEIKQLLYKYKKEEEDILQLKKGLWNRTSGLSDSELIRNQHVWLPEREIVDWIVSK